VISVHNSSSWSLRLQDHCRSIEVFENFLRRFLLPPLFIVPTPIRNRLVSE